MELVLAIEDDPAVFGAVRRTLRGLPIRLLWVESAEEALAILRVERPAVMVADHQLPGMCGLDLLEEVRSRWPGVRVLLHTGDPDAQACARQRRLPVVEKGAPAASLRAFVEALLRERE